MPQREWCLWGRRPNAQTIVITSVIIEALETHIAMWFQVFLWLLSVHFLISLNVYEYFVKVEGINWNILNSTY